MSKKKTILNSIFLCIGLGLLAGCGATDTVSIDLFTANPSDRTAMLDEAELDYEVPVTLPGISVDLYAYDAEASKVAILKGETLPASFELVKASSGESVYKGKVKRKDVESDSGLEIATADFYDFTEPGEYYIKTEILGKSKTFTIEEDAYALEFEWARESLKALKCDGCHSAYVSFENDSSKRMDVSGGWHTSEDGSKDVVEACLAVMDICTIYEYYPDSFLSLMDEANEEIEWLLKMQNSESGGVYTSVSLHEDTASGEKTFLIGGETTRATAYFCACMAKFSVTASKLYPDAASLAFQAALKAWNCLDANKEIVTADQLYRAAVEMYRATGLTVYNNVILDYLKENADKDYEGRLTLDAAISYLATSRNTNVEYDTVLMANYMSRIQAFNDSAELSAYGIEEGDYTADDYLRQAYEFIVADYIMSSSAYRSLEEDYLHYLNGRNADSLNYTATLITPDSYVKLLALLAGLSTE